MPAYHQDSPELADVFVRPRFMADALCVEFPSVTFFPELGESTVEAKRICSRCLVRSECLAYALAFEATVKGGRYGVWGGTSGPERASMAREAMMSSRLR